VENEWVEGKVKKRVLHRLGRLDELLAGGQLDSWIQSLGRLSEKLSALIFQRLFQGRSIDKVLLDFLAGRRFEFPVERAIFLTVLHRLFAAGGDRAAEKWRDDYAIEGVADLELHRSRAITARSSARSGAPLASALPSLAALPPTFPSPVR